MRSIAHKAAHGIRIGAAAVMDLGTRAFFHGFAVVFLWLVMVHKLWFTSRLSSFDEWLFSDCWGFSHRPWMDPPSWLVIAVVAIVVHLGWLLLGSHFDGRRRGPDLLLAGMACAFTAYAGLIQLGASLSNARRMDPPFHYAILDAMRWIGFWGASAAILVSALRAIGMDRKILRKVSVFFAVGIVLSSVPLSRAGKTLGEWRDWQDARVIGTALALDGFVKAHPDSRRVEAARIIAWERVRAKPDLERVRLYLEHAKDWGHRIDSARILERKAIERLRRRSRETKFSGLPFLDGFWRSRIPDPGWEGSGTRIVRYRAEFEPTDLVREARELSRTAGWRVFAPDSSVARLDGDLLGSMVESMLDSAVRGWAGTSILTIAPSKPSDSSPADLVVRLRCKLSGPFEPVPCAPGCPPEKERWTIPTVVLSWTIDLREPGGAFHRTGGQALDTSWASASNEEEAGSLPHAWDETMDMNAAWTARLDRSISNLPGSVRAAWKVRR